APYPPGTPATGSSGSFALSGSEQMSANGSPATAASGSVTISGSLQTYEGQDCSFGECQLITVDDSGNVSVTVNGFAVYAYYASGSSAASIATDLRAGLNDPSSPVTAGGSGSTITLTSKATGTVANYSLVVASAT